MGALSVNLLVRFFLEVIALVSLGTWGWNQTDHWIRYILVFAIPLIVAALWGTFAVPNDPSRSGEATVVISGWMRLLLELSVFGLVTWALYSMNLTKWSFLFMAVVIVHYLASYDRVIWLLGQ
jgi:hypothetical protein